MMPNPYGLQFGEKKLVDTREGRRWVAEADPTEAFWEAWRADKAGMKARGFGCGRWPEGAPWKVNFWETTQPKEELEATRAASRAEDADIDIPRPHGLDYMAFQRGGIAFALQREGTLIGDEMGLGKTIQAIGLANATGARRILVGCPASLKGNWYAEIKKWQVAHLPVFVISPGVHMPMGVDLPEGWWVVSWEIAQKFAKQLKAGVWDLVIIDECHKLKTIGAQRTQFFLGGRVKDKETNKTIEVPAIKAKTRLALTGTPICNRPLELWPFVHWLNPSMFGNLSKFKKFYCYNTDNLGKLQNLLRESVMVRRLKSQVLKDLPAKQRQVVTLDIEDGDDRARQFVEEELETYGRYEREIEEATYEQQRAESEGNTPSYEAAVARLKAARKIMFTEMSRVRHNTALVKVPYVINHLKDLDETKKYIVFGHHNDVIRQLCHAMAPRGALQMTQETPIEERQQLAHRFQDDPDIHFIFGTYGTMGVGFTLTASSHVVTAELDWVPGNVTQAEDRAHRIGQLSSVLVQHLVFDGSLDGKMAKTLVAKQELIDKALDRQPEQQQADAPAADGGTPSQPVQRPVDGDEDEQPERKKPKAILLNKEQVEAVHKALKIIAGYDGDRASALNGIGFSKLDTRFGCELAERSYLSPRQAEVAARMVRKYRRQYPKDLYQRIFGEEW